MSSAVQFINETEIKAAIADLKNNDTPTDWVLLSFESPKSQKVKLVGSGSGGVSELVESFQDDVVGFSLVRKIDKIDDSETVKFAFILFIGDKVGILQKGRISVTSGGVKDCFGSFHVDFQITNKSEISDQIVIQKIQENSGSGSRVLDESGKKTGSTSTSSSSSARRSVYGGVSSPSSTQKDALKLQNEPEIREALKEFRSDASDVNWVLFGYEGGNSNNIVLLGKGTQGTQELISNLTPEIVGYGLVRIVEKIDNSNTVKFAFINWVGENIPRMLRARLGTHIGTIKELVQPYHVDIKCSVPSEISEDIVVDTISRSSGTKLNVLAGTSSPSSSSPSSGGSYRGTSSGSSGGYKPSSVPTSSGSVINIENEAEVKAAIKDVRADSTDTNWCLVGYKNDNTLTLLGSGNGGTDELVSHLKSNIVGYGLVREVEKIDLSETIKFAFIDFVGEEIPRMLRAKLGTHSGKVKELFQPYHVDLHPTQVSEISSEIITQRITTNSGTNSRVR
ncbi:putative actin binding protein [Tieghemostelium lacteum]|uniref:Coactosin n=1 Tax=Tieghemostelium lacteum TaxID=361077 RepID=A0A152A8W2_TIELA|nr:putative actin binding protein [Tieghemostelium lacteum]|eukprot:KYR02663.1 putative actin binding protein [Tieghemostelium lacteum]